MQPFGITCWTHIKKARRPGKSDSNPRGGKGILVGYDDDQGPLLARVYFSDTGVLNCMTILIFVIRVLKEMKRRVQRQAPIKLPF